MDTSVCASMLTKDQLLDIIQIQTEVVQEGINLSQIMFLVTKRAQEITHADGAVIELKEVDEMVYRATAGIADPQLA